MILVVGGTKGGLGKSVTSGNLAVLASMIQKSSILVDADDQRTSRDWAIARSRNERARWPVTTVCLADEGIGDELPRLAEQFEYVIVDAGARDTSVQRRALMAADAVLVPCPPRGQDLWTLDACAHMITECRIVNKRLRAYSYINRADPIGEDNAEAEAALAEYEHIIRPLDIRVGNRKSIAVSHALGLAAFEAQRRDPAAVDELERLYQTIFSCYPC